MLERLSKKTHFLFFWWLFWVFSNCC
jgi:hypothetical protein